MKALTYNDLIQAQKEISAHNQQLREQSEQLEKDNSELRSQSLRLVCAGPLWLLCGWVEGALGGSLTAQSWVLVLDLSPLLHAAAGLCKDQARDCSLLFGPVLDHMGLSHSASL